jgi:hypothetical protein
MVQAILEGRKTVTRRVIKRLPERTYRIEQNEKNIFEAHYNGAIHHIFTHGVREIKPPYAAGDILYVRETWCNWADDIGNNFFYKATDDGVDGFSPKWRPSIHMPKAAARLFLKVTDVRVERLQDITEAQAKAEGVIRLFDDMPDDEFKEWIAQLGTSRKSKSDYGYKNYLWHGDYNNGQGNKMTDEWDYQYSAYDSAVNSFSSLWSKTIPLEEWEQYSWAANPYVWVIEFERISKEEAEHGETN